MRHSPPDGLFPLTQETVEAAFDWIFAPWIKEMGLTDIVVSEGFASMRLPLNDRLKFFSGAVCGQALMAAIDTVASLAAARGDGARQALSAVVLVLAMDSNTIKRASWYWSLIVNAEPEGGGE